MAMMTTREEKIRSKTQKTRVNRRGRRDKEETKEKKENGWVASSFEKE